MTLKTMLLQILAFSAATGFAQTTAQTGIDKANMDLSVKPGNDFYQYAAGGWIERHPLTPEFSRYSQFDELQENNQKQLREMIEQFANNTYPQGSLQQKIGSLYRLSMDSVRRNREGYTPIKGKLAEIEKIADPIEKARLATSKIQLIKKRNVLQKNMEHISVCLQSGKVY